MSDIFEKYDHEIWDKIYYRFRNQVENANENYNHRVLWFIYIQAFLFATIGLLLPERDEIVNFELRGAVDWAILVICILGGYLGILAYVILNHVGAELDELRKDWTALTAFIPEEERLYFPHVAGGRGTIRTLKDPALTEEGSRKRLIRSRFLPLVFTAAWMAIGIPFLWMAYING